MIKPFLIYGANGYTGRLILDEARKCGLRPVIAGRNEEKIRSLAEELHLEYLTFPLNDIPTIASHIKDFPLVLHCAGPFSKTAVPMVEACLLAGSHYLDITGEIEVFERLRTYHARAVDRKIVVMPGVGFDVVPTDCVGAYLHTRLPDATHLELGFMNLGGSISHGTLMTMIQNIGRSGAIRKNGTILSVPIGHKSKWIDFGRKKRFTMTIPWGDVSTAFHTTGIPNIEVYTAVPAWYFRILRLQFLFNPIIRTRPAKYLMRTYVDHRITGPTRTQNANGRSLVWGKVINARGESLEARLEGPESYLLTAQTALHIAKRVLSEDPRPGYHTPAGLFGHTLITEIGRTSLQ